MSKKKVTKTKNKKVEKKGLKNSTIVLFIGILLLLLPAIVFGGILLAAYVTNNSPVVGSRYAGDLNPKINDQQLQDIDIRVEGLNGVEKCEAILTTSQVRINVDTKDNLDKETIQSLIDEVYKIINNVTNIDTYYTSTQSKKMYDLSIDIYNIISLEDDAIHYNLTKNSNMSEPIIQLLSEPLDEDLVKEIHGENVSDLTNSSGRQEASVDDVDDAANNTEE